MYFAAKRKENHIEFLDITHTPRSTLWVNENERNANESPEKMLINCPRRVLFIK